MKLQALLSWRQFMLVKAVEGSDALAPKHVAFQ
jgi:hypothetical protein